MEPQLVPLGSQLSGTQTGVFGIVNAKMHVDELQTCIQESSSQVGRYCTAWGPLQGTLFLPISVNP
jgi:hypothetical protein